MKGNSSVHSMGELLAVCSRSIVEPDLVVAEAARIIEVLNDRSLERKYVVEGYETLSLIASSFFRCGYGSFTDQYAGRTGIDHRSSGFSNKDELIKYCEFCVEYGDEKLHKIREDAMSRLEIENRMTKYDIFNLNKSRNPSTVQDQVLDYIKLSLLVNALKEFFKKYYKGLN